METTQEITTQETALAPIQSAEIQPRANPGCLMTPRNMSEAMEFAKLLASSDLAPKDFKGKPGNCLIAMQMGAEIGLAPMQALQNIAVINGRPSVWGDAALAIVQGSGKLEWMKEWIDGDGDKRTAHCATKRTGYPEHRTYSFSVADAKKAGLWGKSGPWTNYPDRMLQMRARGFNLRDQFADVMRGLAIREEVEDFEVIEAAPVPSIEDLMPKRKSEAAPSQVETPRQEETKPPQHTENSLRKTSNEAPYWTSDFNGSCYLWAKVGEHFSHEFLQEIGMKESPKKPGAYYTKYSEDLEEQLSMRCEEVPS
ncbi:MAG TPA: hypothetical protein DF383_10305 [Deltaproteobacteria bacterium]|nr:hypothetical protein [Deltaproteobacteria bacterium]